MHAITTSSKLVLFIWAWFTETQNNTAQHSTTPEQEQHIMGMGAFYFWLSMGTVCYELTEQVRCVKLAHSGLLVLVPRVIFLTLLAVVHLHVAQVSQLVPIGGLTLHRRVGAARSAVKPPAEVVSGFSWALPSLLLDFLFLSWQS